MVGWTPRVNGACPGKPRLVEVVSTRPVGRGVDPLDRDPGWSGNWARRSGDFFRRLLDRSGFELRRGRGGWRRCRPWRPERKRGSESEFPRTACRVRSEWGVRHATSVPGRRTINSPPRSTDFESAGRAVSIRWGPSMDLIRTRRAGAGPDRLGRERGRAATSRYASNARTRSRGCAPALARGGIAPGPACCRTPTLPHATRGWRRRRPRRRDRRRRRVPARGTSRAGLWPRLC